ncbi:hypothetical protein [Pseudoalteromonas sp. S554]|uniref:hypothetical protein n=1 Tax=Pseudoalteromonas sp. S554 TaxID=2066516 RepID=UPI00110D1B24|nr:hypothetical protein [Pseudoalteromonas sp. S554]TMS79709.1 hypothetical protein CWB65_18785 [Pseudoalteromonas sp. S554]
MKFKFDIKANAIDSFNEALAKYEQGLGGDLKAFKFSITHLAHSIELVLKMYMQTLDDNLVFSKCYKEVLKRSKADETDLLSAFNALENEGFDFGKLIQGHISPHTVTVEQALSIAKSEVCGITGNHFVDQDFIDDINWMKDLRNSIEHFEFEFTAKEVRLCVGRLVRGLAEFTDIFSLFDLDEEVGEDRIHIFKVLADEYEHALSEANISVSEQKHLLFAGVRPKHRMFIEWNVYTCPSCGNDTMIPNDDSSTGYRCTLEGCENEESEDIEVDCDICGSPWPNGEMTSWEDTYSYVCPRCENPEAW